MTEENIDLSAFFDQSDWTPAAYGEWADRIYASRESREKFEDMLKSARESGGNPLSVAIGLSLAANSPKRSALSKRPVRARPATTSRDRRPPRSVRRFRP